MAAIAFPYTRRPPGSSAVPWGTLTAAGLAVSFTSSSVAQPEIYFFYLLIFPLGRVSKDHTEH